MALVVDPSIGLHAVKERFGAFVGYGRHLVSGHLHHVLKLGYAVRVEWFFFWLRKIQRWR
jgi:hypothetical protein